MRLPVERQFVIHARIDTDDHLASASQISSQPYSGECVEHDDHHIRQCPR